jgi:ferredoxin like protein
MNNQSMTDKLFTIRYKCSDHSHLALKEPEVCARCAGKSCNTFCPAEVYGWDEESKVNHVAYENCVECGTCRIACPSDNVAWAYPMGGYGISYRFG